MEKRIYLNKENFIASIFDKSGYFCEHFPFCFNTETLSVNWYNIKNEIEPLLPDIENKHFTSPIFFTIYKSENIRRTIYLPNIISYLKLLCFTRDNLNDIKLLCRSKNSESKIGYIANFAYPSNFKKSIIERNSRFVGFRYKLKLDITNFYNSIYTHSLAWAAVGKNIAKKMHNKEMDTNSSYTIGANLDKLNQKMNNNQTNGLLTGPFSSRIMSELIMARLDDELRICGFEFVRYIDDYSFYFSNINEAQESIAKISKVLGEYNLLLNGEKIKIEEFPFDVLDDFYNKFNNDLDNNRIYDALQRAFIMAQSGKVVAIKYLLKTLRKKDIPRSVISPVFNQLINTMLAFPALSPHVTEIIEKYLLLMSVSGTGLSRKLEPLIERELNLEHDHEVMWLFYILMKSETKISLDLINTIIKKGNDFEIIMCLDVLFNRFNDYRNKTIKKAHNLIDAESKNRIMDKLKNVTMDSEHWLLGYTIAINNWKIKDVILDKLKKSQEYKIFKKYNINFYKSFY